MCRELVIEQGPDGSLGLGGLKPLSPGPTGEGMYMFYTFTKYTFVPDDRLDTRKYRRLLPMLLVYVLRPICAILFRLEY